MNSPRIIATEEAFAIPEQIEGMKKIIKNSPDYDPDLFLWNLTIGGADWTDQLLDLEYQRLEIMDAAGVDMHLLSLTSTGVQMFDADEGTEIARIANDRLAEVIARHPDRFAGLATIAPQDPLRAVKEMERAINQLKLNGIIINSHTNGEYLCEPKYWPILEAAEALDTPIYIHPRSPVPDMAAPYKPDHLEHAIWGYAAETGLHGVRLITGGIFDRFPHLQIVLGHMGEAIPYWLYRLDYMHVRSEFFGRPKLKLKPSDYFKRNFTITTSGVNWDPVLQLCIKVLGVENVMFAIDYPYQETIEAVEFIKKAEISEPDRVKVMHENAERVFKILPQ